MSCIPAWPFCCVHIPACRRTHPYVHSRAQGSQSVRSGHRKLCVGAHLKVARCGLILAVSTGSVTRSGVSANVKSAKAMGGVARTSHGSMPTVHSSVMCPPLRIPLSAPRLAQTPPSAQVPLLAQMLLLVSLPPSAQVPLLVWLPFQAPGLTCVETQLLISAVSRCMLRQGQLS